MNKQIIVAIAAGIVITAFAAYVFYDFSLTKETTSEPETTKISPDSDPLSSWNSGDSKQKIIEFVNQVTDSSSSSFVPIMDRIATFDNDGTLWIEQPLYIPFAFHLEYLYEQLDDDPSLASTSPYSEIVAMGDSITNKDLEHIPGLIDILLPAYPDITQEEYLQKSKEYLDNTKHTRYNVALKELTYQPMVELVHYLQQNDFEVYIVSAGFQGMMQSVSKEIYNIEKENVIGTHPEFISQLTEQGSVLIRQPTLGSFNDGAEKPVNIQKIIGKTPIFACGNSGGDIEMLMLTQNHKNHFACMLNHDDESREYYYPNQEALDESQKNGWIVISMKNDFKTIFS
ncbi:MAG: haloacid dehalogenase-like hydrolase [Thaumarchaeota archaeon]|nr:haloacid dehalogenase-like hydrolase [Nitrososphaerota archaeon]